MIRIIVLGLSIVGIVIFTVLALYAVLALFIARGFQDKDRH